MSNDNDKKIINGIYFIVRNTKKKIIINPWKINITTSDDFCT